MEFRIGSVDDAIASGPANCSRDRERFHTFIGRNNMATHWLNRADSNQLSKLLRVDPAAEDIWTDPDLAWSLQNLLDGPIPLELVEHDQKSARTIRALITSASPSIDALKSLKVFAKSAVKAHQPNIPTDVATAVYHAAIAAAFLRPGMRLTQLDDDALMRSWRWALGCNWIDAELRQLFTAAMRKLAVDVQ